MTRTGRRAFPARLCSQVGSSCWSVLNNTRCGNQYTVNDRFVVRFFTVIRRFAPEETGPAVCCSARKMFFPKFILPQLQQKSNCAKTTSTANDASKNQTPPTLLSSLRSVLFVIGTVVIAFAAFCNSLTWHLQRFWGASGDFWQAQWDKILDKFGDDPVTLWVYGSWAMMLSVYWVVGGIYTILDITNRPAALRRYKIQPGTNEPVDKRKLCKVIGQVLFNQIIVGFPVIYLSYYIIEWRGYPPVRELPTFHWVLAEIAIHILCEEIGFYYSHRFLHKGILYKFIHKQHHEWTAPIAVTAMYCHPLENIGSNLLPPFLGVFVMGSHVATAWLWFSLAILSTLNAHSGYHLPFFPSPEAHDFHHLKFNQCYGVLGVLDRIHGTDTQFRNSRCYARHVMMLSLVPPREAFPDEVKYKSKSSRELSPLATKFGNGES